MYEVMVRPLTEEEKDLFIRESLKFGSCFGIPQKEVPKTWKAFKMYNLKMWHSDTLAVPEGGHGMSLQRFLFKPPSKLFSLPMSWVKLCTGVLLPPTIAAQ